ncbi:putative small nucleolar ribonucleoprotein complex subunit utp14 protein [Phaeoacremonium minimum UCRPA7]|uniref:Putative small nucleolar ribonucleoprotein complex subunit utp14 protein n=1 Tax=Phaeoacremonium minimum (strain UCR-PA7) TaxID=1286976 RepID=R8BKF4_PHAM7|nr:putative small nucleolar ribonucleoprotein complex subunit utp14 protein [Phaeoacremonium minimum UCRPA7]EON99796.1 putative small nucleolar ribonucleoprotein complex subunit utp14 protein [Phaeoacremonium minimum UCRPA7]
MPGRQAHGRPLLAQPTKKRAGPKSKAKSRGHALDAFAIASKQVEPERITRRGRDLDLEPEKEHKKHRRDEDDDEDEDEDGGADEDEGPRKKRARRSAFNEEDGENSEDDERGSDSEGHEWHVGVDGEDEDSEIDSDEAFGESDDDRFDGYKFGGSRAKEDEDDSDAEDDDSLGEDAIDLAQALDQVSDEDDEGSAGDTESGSEDGEESESESSVSEDEDEDEDDPSKMDALQSLIKGFADDEGDHAEADGSSNSKQKISLKDLGLFGVKDPDMKKSLKLMKKEEHEGKASSSKKLDVPLAKRQQDRLDRAAAYDKTNQTLNKWTETVKHNRRADHLVFPLANTLPNAGLDNGELLPLTKKTAGTELEQTIMSIMEESGLGPSAKQKDEQKQLADGEPAETISRADLQEIWAQRRRDRELQSREQAKAKRIKKIKSKAYRRVHRKENLRNEEATYDAMKAAGEIDSEEERETQHRRRAMERMGSRHKESKWAKMASKTGRAAWDDDFRSGLTDMARRDEELRRRVEGRTGTADDGDDSDATSSSGDDDGNSRLLQQLNRLEDDADEAPQSNLMKMAFMQKAEAARKRANDELIAQIRRDLDSENESDVAEGDVGRRTYGAPKTISSRSEEPAEEVNETTGSTAQSRSAKAKTGLSAAIPTVPEPQTSTPGGAGAWSRGGKPSSKKDKKLSSAQVAELDLSSNILIASKPASKAKPKTTQNGTPSADDSPSDSDDEGAMHLPLAVRNQELVARAFAGDDVVGEFEREKEAAVEADDDKVVDNTLPGWGSWVGEGVSNRERRRHQGRFVTTVAGVKRKDRKDARLERVIVNEKRVHKNDKYLASQLPHPFESRNQYERSLRLPMGPEWMTKESFQAVTKPRVIVKQGIIAPMSKPVL